MKKLTLLLFVILTSFAVNAQENFGFLQSEIFVEGNFQLSSYNNENSEDKESSYSINPKVGYFISDDLAVGIQGSYTSFSEDVITEITTTTEGSSYAAGLFGRYYFLELGTRFYTYGELGGTYSVTEGSTSIDGTSRDLDTLNTINASLSLGINYFANREYSYYVSVI